jgi:hypothetical protein
MLIGKLWLQLIQNIAPHIHKTGAARSSQVFASGTGQHIAAHSLHVQLKLPRGLTGIQQIKNIVPACQLSHLFGRMNHPALARYMRESDKSDIAVDSALQVFQANLTFRIICDHLYFDIPLFCHVQQGNKVAGVFGLTSQNAVTRLQRQCMKQQIPRPGSTLCISNLAGGAIEQPGEGLIKIIRFSAGLLLCFVSPYTLLQQQMLDKFIDDWLRIKCRAGIIKMDEPLAGRGIIADEINVQIYSP